MSEPIPESIPTSQDPRSKRPTKKRALTPTSAQALTLQALFSKPTQEISIPPSSGTSSGTKATSSSSVSAPPEIVANVQGSSAGAGSGEFHVYKASRRREYERVRAMGEEVRGETEARDFERQRREAEERDRERTRRNRERREKIRKRKGKAAGGGKGAAGAAAAAAAEVGRDGDGEEEEGGGMVRKGPRVDGGDGDEAPVEALGNGVESVMQEAGLIIHDDD